MGGSSKPADPVVTPYQEPAAPTNPIPNFFGGRAGSGFVPDTGASQQAFTMPAQAAPQAAGQGYQEQAMDRPSMPFSIPTRHGNWADQMRDGSGMSRFMQRLQDMPNIWGQQVGAVPRNVDPATPRVTPRETPPLSFMRGGR